MTLIQRWSSLFLLVVMSGAISCAPPLSGSANKQRELEDRKELLEVYREFAGTYAGVIEEMPDRSDPFGIEMKVFIAEEHNGLNEDGEARFRPALRARYRRTDFPKDGIGERTLIVRYYRETGELAASTSPTSPSAGSVLDSSFLSITGTLDAAEKVMKVELRDHRGFLGVATLVKVN
ncbi:MAG: hypothetical protein A2X94_10620 [Bdellovibrionales bacterium GWB1_55_8]|nr:MAG: hypothetical protein A2X94_10620 [Bdellovibrionales bacterium GWB1_55_8]